MEDTLRCGREHTIPMMDRAPNLQAARASDSPLRTIRVTALGTSEGRLGVTGGHRSAAAATASNHANLESWVQRRAAPTSPGHSEALNRVFGT
jgi:hypothetical protein